jgi:hypothetical protein
LIARDATRLRPIGALAKRAVRLTKRAALLAAGQLGPGGAGG